MKTLVAALGILLATGCTSTSPAAPVAAVTPTAAGSPSVSTSLASSPSPSSTPAVSPVSAASPSPLPAGIPVVKQVLAPATVPPLVALCSATLATTANGNAWPLQCRGGAVNVLAWNFYAGLVPRTLALGYTPSAAQITAALCQDATVQHATRPELMNGYSLAAAYNGWTNPFDLAQMTCQ